MIRTQEERTRRAQHFATTSKRQWLMIRETDTLWITAGRYTFDELMSKPWKSTPVVSVKKYQAENLRALQQLRRGMREHLTGRRT